MRPLVAAPAFGDRIHGADGLGGVDLPGAYGGLAAGHGVDAILEQAARPDLTVVAVGPLTNLAVALVKRPDLAGRIPQLVALLRERLLPDILSALDRAGFNVGEELQKAATAFGSDILGIVGSLIGGALSGGATTPRSVRWESSVRAMVSHTRTSPAMPGARWVGTHTARCGAKPPTSPAFAMTTSRARPPRAKAAANSRKWTDAPL